MRQSASTSFVLACIASNVPRWAQLMMPFFNRTELERVGVVGPDLDCCGLV